MSTMTAAPFVFALGDTLRMPVTFRNPAKSDGSLGDPIDLTGKEASGRFYTPGRPPLLLTTGSGLVVTASAGLMDFTISDAVSETFEPDPPHLTLPPILAEGFTYPHVAMARFPTRLRVSIRDLSSGDIGTIAIFAVRLYDPANVDLANLPVAQAGTVIAAP